MLTVSVIIPTYNRESTIIRALDSVTAQTFQDYEIIVVDDCSTDNTGEVVGNYHDERVRFVQLSENRGPGAARNEGIRQAKGRYIAFLDSDDEWAPTKLQKQVELMEDLGPEWGLCATQLEIIKDGNIKVYEGPDKKYLAEPFCAYISQRHKIQTSTIMIRKEALDDVGFFDERLRRHQDADLWIRLLSKYKMAAVFEPLARMHLRYRDQFADAQTKSAQIIVQKHYCLIKEKCGIFSATNYRGRHYLQIAESNFREGRKKKGIPFLIKSITYWPIISPKRIINALFALMGLLHITRRIRDSLCGFR
jgi:glycosyltransferase involved in cell wall biosynthesis